MYSVGSIGKGINPFGFLTHMFIVASPFTCGIGQLLHSFELSMSPPVEIEKALAVNLVSIFFLTLIIEICDNRERGSEEREGKIVFYFFP